MDNNTEQDKIRRFERIVQKQSGTYHADSYTNVMNNYGTQKDTTEHYHFQAEAPVPDDVLTMYYESNGLFAKIIDAPAEEAVKHGFELDINDQEIEKFYTDALDELDWEGAVMTAIKWTRLFGGCIIVMLTDDERGLEEPLDWDNVKAINGLRIFDRSIVQEDTSAIYSFSVEDGNEFRPKAERLGMPQYYDVYSRYGTFRVHESRCLIFQNGILPENTSNSTYQMWGIPEYIRINRAVRDAEVAHGSAVKLLDRSIQAVYKMRGLSAELATEKGEDRVLKRLQAIDMARGLMNSILIDADGEDYDFKTFQFAGVADVIDTTCNYLSALTNIPQTVLFGRSPSGMNSTGESDLENWYSYVERIQKRMIKKNLRYLLAVIFHVGKHNGVIDEIPQFNIQFNPLWSMSDAEKADLEIKRASAQQTRAQTAQLYMDAQVLDPQEVRRKLAASDEFDIETLLDDIPEEDLFANMPSIEDIMPTDEMFGEEADPAPTVEEDSTDAVSSAAVLLIRNGKILTGTRQEGSHPGEICGPGGHIEEGETPEQAAVRETQEEFGITPKNLTLLGYGPTEPNGLKPAIYLATEYEGDFKMVDGEMAKPCFRSINKLAGMAEQLFPPFLDSLNLLLQSVLPERMDDDVDAWITVNGAHVPLDEAGTAIGGAGGAFTGQTLSQAHAASKAATAARAAAKAAKTQSSSQSSNRQPVTHDITTPDEAVDKIQKAALAAAESGKTSYSDVKTQMFNDTQNTGLPQIASAEEFEAIESDCPVMYRGFEESSQMTQFYDGDAYIGSGFAGSGTNTAINLEDTSDFGGENVLEMKLIKGAKVISEDDFMPIYTKVRESFAQKSGTDTAKYASRMSRDPGCVAAALGYDAIYSDVHEWYNIINRSMLVVKEVDNSE